MSKYQRDRLGRFVKGIVPWNKGFGDYIRGEKHWSWKGGGYYHHCKFCKREFKSSVKTSIFCSRSCKSKFWAPILNKKHVWTEESRKKVAEYHRIIFSDKTKNPMFGKHHSYKTRKLIAKKNRIQTKLLWKNPEYRENVIKNTMKGLFKRPTSLEKLLISIISEFNLPFSYVGDGKVLVNFRNPDFIHNNGEKKIIEVANSYHHEKGKYEAERTKVYSVFGFKTLVLWDTDFYIDPIHNRRKLLTNWKQNILKKIKVFLNETS